MSYPQPQAHQLFLGCAEVMLSDGSWGWLLEMDPREEIGRADPARTPCGCQANKHRCTLQNSKWKSSVFKSLTNLHRADCSLTVWQTACHTMRYMVELLEAVGMQQVEKRCACMSMSNNSPTLVYATCIRCAATHALTHALTIAQARVQTHSRLSV